MIKFNIPSLTSFQLQRLPLLLRQPLQNPFVLLLLSLPQLLYLLVHLRPHRLLPLIVLQQVYFVVRVVPQVLLPDNVVVVLQSSYGFGSETLPTDNDGFGLFEGVIVDDLSVLHDEELLFLWFIFGLWKGFFLQLWQAELPVRVIYVI